MGDVAGGGADGYYRRYTYGQLLSMVLADSIDDAEANRQQWRRLGRALSDAATAADKIAKDLPDHYRSQHAAPALLKLLHETNKTAHDVGQVAYDNSTAWLGVKQSLQAARADVARLAAFARSGLEEPARDYAADRIQKLTSEYINHANDILPPLGTDSAKQPMVDPFGSTDSPGSGATSDSGGPTASGSKSAVRGDPSGGPGEVGGLPDPGSGTTGPSLGGGPTTLPGTGPGGRTPHGGPSPGRGLGRGAPGILGAPGGGTARGGSSFGPVGRTLGGKVPPGTGLPDGSAPLEGGPGTRLPGGTGAEPPAKPGTPAVPGSGGPGGPGSMSPHGGGGGKRRRQTRRRGGLKGDPDDFRYSPDVVAPAEIWPDEERPVTNVGKTIGGKQVSEEPQWTMSEPANKRPESRPRPSPLPDGEVRIDGHNVSFKMRRSGSA